MSFLKKSQGKSFLFSALSILSSKTSLVVITLVCGSECTDITQDCMNYIMTDKWHRHECLKRGCAGELKHSVCFSAVGTSSLDELP